MALVGAFLLYLAANPDSAPLTAMLSLIAGLLLFVITLFMLVRYYRPGHDDVSPDEVPAPEWKVSRFLRRARDAAPLFLGIRLFLGYEWLQSGWGKLQNPAWGNGEALRGFWERAIAIPEAPARPAITYPVYRSVIEFMLNNGWETWFGQIIRWGELLIGLGLLFGGLTAIAAFFGLLLNFSFVYAGSASSNPTFIILGLLIILGWRVAGWWGLDRFLLPTLGTPWAAVPPDEA
jgi:thiosulfate dehydrogenase [quinone] large subunit